MSDQEVTQIRVGGHVVGIIGLKEAIEDIDWELSAASEDRIGEMLLEKLSKHNYIPPTMNGPYKRALVLEYKKSIGESVEGDQGAGVAIKVLGPGCHQCDQLMQEVMEVLGEMKTVVDLEHVRESAIIGTYGVLGTPALVINNEVKVVGSVPPKARIKAWIEDAVKEEVEE